jgi:hypothetical protein
VRCCPHPTVVKLMEPFIGVESESICPRHEAGRA